MLIDLEVDVDVGASMDVHVGVAAFVGYEGAGGEGGQGGGRKS